MHRFWGDALPDYSEAYKYSADQIYSKFLLTALDHTDHQLGRIRKFVSKEQDTSLVIAASMGQGPIEKKFGDQDGGGLFVLGDHTKLVSALGLSRADAGLAMHPYLSLVFVDDDAAAAAVGPLESVQAEGIGALFPTVRREGRSVAFALTYSTGHLNERAAMATPVRISRLGMAFPRDRGGISYKE